MTDFLHGSEVVEVTEGPRPIRTVRSAVIGLVGSAPIGPVNTPVLIAGNRVEAVRKFGVDIGTIPDALEAIFKQAGAVVVVVNVLDPATHKTDVSEQLVKLDGDTGAFGTRYVSGVTVQSGPGVRYVEGGGSDYTVDLATGVLTRVGAGTIPAADSRLWVEYDEAGAHQAKHVDLAGGTVDLGADVSNLVVRAAGAVATYAADADFTVDAVAGTLTRTAAGAIAADAEVLVSYTVPDETKVTAADIEGGVDPTTDAFTGISALLGARTAVGFTPRILIAPGYSSQKSVADALISVGNRMRAVTPIEGPDTTDAAAIAYRGNFGHRRAYLVDPGVRVMRDGAIAAEPNSAYVAGVISGNDNDPERGFWWSPSNRVILGIVDTGRPIDFTLGDSTARANLLNEREVATIIREQGFRLWGNRTCATDPKWAFLSVVRTADLINDSILRAHLWAVDRGITKTYLKDVAEGVNAYLAEIRGVGAIINGRCWVTPDLNTEDSLAAGRAYWDFDFTPPPPAERLTFRSRITNDYLEEILL